MRVIAHRGASGTTPENTRFSIATAINGGADLVEIDLQLTKDNYIVIFHDRDLNRIVGESSTIKDHSLEELKQKDVGAYFGDGFRGQEIPTITEIISEFPGVDYILEIKPQKNDATRTLESNTLATLKNLDYKLNTGYISVRDFDTYNWFQEQNSEIRIGVMQKNREPDEFINLLNQNNVKIAQIRWKTFDAESITALNEIVDEIYCFSADTPQDWDILLDWPIQGILTNYPNELKTYYYYWLKNHSDTIIT